MLKRPARAIAALAAACLATALPAASADERASTAARPGARVLLDAHNAYPYNGRWAGRLDRALSTGVPIAIEQDLVWRPAGHGLPARSIVSHGEPFDDREPSLREHFFERIRPLVERALAAGDRTHWPLIVLNLDLKTNEPEHHRAVWELLGEYEPWLTTAERTDAPSTPAPLDAGPVLVLTGEADEQERSFHDDLPAGARLRVFGAMPIRPAAGAEASEEERARFWRALPDAPFPAATNYRRWWNAPWSLVEAGGQREAGEWTAAADDRLRTLVRRAHEAGLWVRLWTVNGHPPGAEEEWGWSPNYNVGSLERARVRWRAAIAAGADFVATDQYEELASELRRARRREAAARGAPRSPAGAEPADRPAPRTDANSRAAHAQLLNKAGPARPAASDREGLPDLGGRAEADLPRAARPARGDRSGALADGRPERRGTLTAPPP